MKVTHLIAIGLIAVAAYFPFPTEHPAHKTGYECATYTRLGDLQLRHAQKDIEAQDFAGAYEHLQFAKQNYFQNAHHCGGREEKLETVNKLISNKDLQNLAATQNFIKAALK